MVWGTCTMYVNNYNVFDDKYTLLYMIVYSILFTICMFLVRTYENSFRIWQKPKQRSQNAFRNSIRVD